ncbi:alpha/beta hydrolase family esterase [Gemmatimonadota bacterium]
MGPQARSLWAGTLLAFSGCTSAGGPATPEVPSLSPGDHTFSLDAGGLPRRYLVRIPPSPPQGPTPPLLVAFHGGGGNPEQFRETAGLDAIADREGFVVVYPGGTGLAEAALTWNAGPGCCGFARDRNVDDVAFFLSLLDDLASRHPIDTSRVYVTGHSNGSMMAYRIASEASQRVAGAVGVAGTMQLPAVQPRFPVPVLHLHSEDDPRAFYDGGVRDDRVHPPVEDMLHRWADENGCVAPPVGVETRTGSAGGPDSGHTARLLRWSCREAPLEHWRLTGAGHPWPGHRVSAARELIVGPSTEVVSAAEEVWRFPASLGG